MVTLVISYSLNSIILDEIVTETVINEIAQNDFSIEEENIYIQME